ncbi:MAG: proline--tRNA ligase [Thermoplasmata archaeon]
MADLPDKQTSFMEWYLEVVERAELTDKRYPVKGMNVWTPYGYRARRELDRVMIREIEATHSQPVEFPTLIPETEFQKEKEHIKGFDREVYWVTRGGAATLDVPLVLRPTSETAMYPVFALWIRSHRDLPLNVYQVVNTFRYETKTTRPFLRVREIHFFEEHTCQTDEEAASDRVQSNLAAFRRMADAWALPYLPTRRPEWDKFAGAYYSIAFDIPVGGGRTLQIGSVHHYRENFSRAYGITYEDPQGARRYAHQTTFGLSERLLGAVVAVHGDQKGVVLPSSLAPYQVAIVPIADASGDSASVEFAERLGAELGRHGLRVHVDRRPDRPGAKYYHWETRGVPLRLDIGRRETTQGSVTAVNRLGQRSSLGPDRLVDSIENALSEFDAELRRRAQSSFAEQFEVAPDLESLRGSAKVELVAWCGSEACGHALEEAINGGLLGIPEGPLPIPVPDPTKCLVCQKSPARWAVAGRPI